MKRAPPIATETNLIPEFARKSQTTYQTHHTNASTQCSLFWSGRSPFVHALQLMLSIFSFTTSPCLGGPHRTFSNRSVLSEEKAAQSWHHCSRSSKAFLVLRTVHTRTEPLSPCFPLYSTNLHLNAPEQLSSPHPWSPT